MVQKDSGSGSVTISFGAALTYLRALIKTLGLVRALRESVRIAIRLFGRDGTEVRFRRRREVTPHISGAPLGWMSGLSLLLAQSEKSVSHSELESRIRQLVQRQVHMRNVPTNASVTVVIPAFENRAHVLSCIESIVSWPSNVNVRILVGDDSIQNDLTCLGSLAGVTVKKQATNLGFLHNVNSLMAVVDTKYAFLLNQDTILLPGAIDDLYDHLEGDVKVGVVAPMILDRQLNVLELGGSVDASGVARHRYRGTNFADWNRLNTANVGYVSGCAMMLRTDLWNTLGGFDPTFSPGYYEDVDFCMRVRRMNLQVRAVSSAFVMHLEGGSHGIVPEDVSSIKSAQNTNQHVFAKKWGAELLEGQMTNQAPQRPVIALFDRIPDPHRDGGSSDARNFLGHLTSLGHPVVVVSLVEESALSTHELRRAGVRFEKSIRSALSWASATRPIVVSFGLSAGHYLRNNLPTSARTTWVHISTDVVTRRLESALANAHTIDAIEEINSNWHVSLPSDPNLLWEIEKDVLQTADRVLYVSREDQKFVDDRIENRNASLFQILKGDPVSVTEPVTTALTVSMVGYWRHHPNREALKYMVNSVWPLVKHSLPDAKLLIWGSYADEVILNYARAGADVQSRGWFRDWSQVAAETRVVASPVYEGAGMKNHVVSAIMARRPVVGTRLSFDGLPQLSGADQYMASSPETFATLVIEALISRDRWNAIVSAQQSLLIDFQGAEQEQERLRRILDELN